MCGPGPHPGGVLFQALCRLADRFRASAGDPGTARIGSVLSLLAVHATRAGDQDFRYELGSLLMDLALDDESRLTETVLPPEDASHTTLTSVRPVPYARVYSLR
ncbi:uncharacterized protein CMC5_032160 [Chondromyces crocatus]|uniref:Uncharacterized protein n=1 Tax=Chondromyces crocatus TaxID=52 RepID=A0A0K1EDZ9_CHOCO|nr:uncharacterized protein CMC5_032160 [Chondromyces crocatus]